MRPIRRIILHCAATPEGKEYTVAQIDEWHRARGFDCIGYHYVIGLDGKVHEGRRVERAGAHCTGHNGDSIGVCYIGGVAADGKTPRDTRTPAQHRAMEALVKRLLEQYPGATVHGHNEFAKKACPSFNVKQWLAEAGIKS